MFAVLEACDRYVDSIFGFVMEVGAHHIYDDTWFCHNYRHRSVISMTILFARPIMSRKCLFYSEDPSFSSRFILARSSKFSTITSATSVMMASKQTKDKRKKADKKANIFVFF